MSTRTLLVLLLAVVYTVAYVGLTRGARRRRRRARGVRRRRRARAHTEDTGEA